MRPMLRSLMTLFLGLALAGCAATAMNFDTKTQEVAYKELTTITEPKDGPIVIAVYDFVDMTGQKKPIKDFASMSTAVTQGSYQLLIKALQDAGEGKWFRVVERHSLASLLQERKLIRTTRQMADGEKAEALPALLFAGAYVTGGVVGYDSNIVTGGAGARVLGIQAHKQYRQDVVSIILRLVNVQSGEVIITTTIEKTIFSTETGGDIFKYFDASTMLVEIEAGVARNEPVTFAVRKAIEAGVVELIKRGVEKDLWKYKEIDELDKIEAKLKEEEAWNNVDESTIVDENIESDTGTIDESLSDEKTYQDYLIEKDAGVHDKSEKSKEVILDELEELLEEESTNEQDNETSAIIPNIHTS